MVALSVSITHTDELLLRLQRTRVLRVPHDAGLDRLQGFPHLCAPHLQVRRTL